MNIANRLRKLEKLEALVGPASLLDRWRKALDQASLRVGAKPLALLAQTDAAFDAVIDEMNASFYSKLTSAEKTRLMAELEPIAFANDPVGLEKWQRETAELLQGGASQ